MKHLHKNLQHMLRFVPHLSWQYLPTGVQRAIILFTLPLVVEQHDGVAFWKLRYTRYTCGSLVEAFGP